MVEHSFDEEPLSPPFSLGAIRLTTKWAPRVQGVEGAAGSGFVDRDAGADFTAFRLPDAGHVLEKNERRPSVSTLAFAMWKPLLRDRCAFHDPSPGRNRIVVLM